MLCLSWAGCPSFNTVDVNQREKRHGEKVEWIRQSWPLFMREGYLCEQGERSSLGYEAPDVWCWQETLTFGVKLEFFLNDWELEYCSIKLCFSLSQCFFLHWWHASLTDDVETGLLHCCNRSNILTWHDLVITSLKKNITFFLFKISFSTGPISSSSTPSMSITIFQYHLRAFTVCTANITAVSAKQPVYTPILSIYSPFKSKIVLSLFIWCQTLNNIWTHILSCPWSSRSLRLGAVNLSELLSVLSAVYIVSGLPRQHFNEDTDTLALLCVVCLQT